MRHLADVAFTAHMFDQYNTRIFPQLRKHVNFLTALIGTTSRKWRMMDFREKQIAPPKNWSLFENLCLALFKAMLKDPLAKKNGRTGQAQHGVDIVGISKGTSPGLWGIQCKGKEQGYGAKASLKEFEAELVKAEGFVPKLSRWIFASTSPSDAVLQKGCREISEQREAEGHFGVDVLSWDDIQGLIADYPSVLRDVYPEHAFDIPGILDRLNALPTASHIYRFGNAVIEKGTPEQRTASLKDASDGIWVPVTFDDHRDLGPAIMGRPLGPADAAACPPLLEITSLVSQLRIAHSARLVGEPGAGKSVCTYQVALQMVNEGWKVFRLRDASKDIPHFFRQEGNNKTLFLIDDAHLMPETILRTAEGQTTSLVMLLSAHTASQPVEHMRGTISIDSRRAVDTIARSLRSEHLADTLKLVQIADDSVGENAGNETIESRIDHAADKATFPWQFCFILGGGWRRAKVAADNARLAGADLALACAAIIQIASGDARAGRSQIVAVLRSENLDDDSIDNSINWLLSQRLLVAADDLRCPHQRFAAVVINRILTNQNDEVRQRIGHLIGQALANETYPLSGIRNLLHEIAFGGSYHGQWTRLVPSSSLETLNDRCWTVVSPRDRMFACLVVTELEAYVSDWRASVIEPRLSLLAEWISDPVAPSGSGLGHLLNHLRNSANTTLASIVSHANPDKVANAVSTMTVESSYSLAEMLGSIANKLSKDWAGAVARKLDREKLLELAENWPLSEGLWRFSRFCMAIGWYDESLSLDLVEHALPIIVKAFLRDPIEAFREVDDVLMDVLRMFDPLGVFVGKLRPDARRASLARRICLGIDAAKLSQQLSEISKRNLQQAAFVLSFLRRVAPRKFENVAGELDLSRIDSVIGEDWKNLSHDAEVFLGVTYMAKNAREGVVALINRNAERFELFPTRLAAMAPEVALRHVESGGKIALVRYSHVDWHFGPAILAYFAERRQDLFDNVIRPWEVEIAHSLCQADPSWYEEATALLSVLRSASPASLQRILGFIDVTKAREGWKACLGKKGAPRKSVSLLVEEGKNRQDAVGLLARELRAKFPRSSIHDTT